MQTAVWALGQKAIFIQYIIYAYKHMIHCCPEHAFNAFNQFSEQRPK